MGGDGPKTLLIRTLTLKRGTVVAHVTVVNEIPPKLTPKIIVKASTVNVCLSVHLSTGIEIEKEHVHLDTQ